ncbi:MAG: UDP-N-acetylglucosamine 1-carboxyvinyltransferase [Acidobacteria bacterium 13_2_20CM_57_17]|nr:MAG: UDP-N-acetylglucosamine 1-carboxyvinyltransferase [Acidobacteria bacterium 13_2_20CM_57_17]OLB94239.1 MAG: UDP-N-acetylglucosamine 1-carboxyvinyltransferase [Acidobacteria bacterium 13_2_20CM_2_57_12]
MDKFRIKGGKALRGTVAISGAKNSALPVMAAALLTAEKVTLHNIPKVRDLITMSKLLAFMDAQVSITEMPASDYVIETPKLNHAEAPYELVKTMRASVLTLGPLMARVGVARVSLPGGCAIGARPVDLHLKALEQMGAEIGTSHGYIEAQAPMNGKKRLKGAHIVFERITVTGTENILMAAVLADGETVLENAAREPEVTDLIVMLRKMGAQICGDGTSTLRIRGVGELHGTEHTVIPDRIEAGTFLVAGAITGGDLTITDCAPEHLGAVIAKLEQAGVRVDIADKTTVRVRGAKKLVGADVTTEEYPGFATDMQAQYMALATQAEGTSVISERIFENRFLHASEMMRMGANISIEGHTATVRGPAALSGSVVQASDLRASAGLVLAGLVANGETLIERVYHIDRGYEGIVEKLQGVGADIERVHGAGS